MVRRRCFTLALAAVLLCGFLYLRLRVQHRPPESRSRRIPPTMPAAECSHLRSLIINSTSKMFKGQKFFQMMRDLQRCPWVPDLRERLLLQSEFSRCCDARRSLIVTQENSPVGRSVSYDGEKTTRNITGKLHSLFPKESPFLIPLGSCAVVGNAGILNGSFCGAEIDRADFVFRMNFPPLNWTDDVGTKTDLVTGNPSILIDRFGSLRERRKPFISVVRAYGSSLVLLPAFSFLMNTEVSLRALYALEDFDLPSRVVFFDPDYLKRLAAHWRKSGLQSRRMSSGLMLVSAAAEVCEKLTLYGFWPFSEDLNGSPVPNHYYDDTPPKRGMHAMPEEFHRYLQMHARGALRLNFVQC